jgi:hypothetical protein
VHGITVRLRSHGVVVSTVEFMDGEGLGTIPSVSSTGHAACAIVADPAVSAASLEAVAIGARGENAISRVFPVLLPNASETLVAGLWPKWEWIDFRFVDTHDQVFATLLDVVAGPTPQGALDGAKVSIDLSRPSPYEEKLLHLKRLRYVGLEEDIYYEGVRKIIDLVVSSDRKPK